MSAVIVFRGLNGSLYAGTAPTDGQFLMEFDPEYAEGLGWSDWTSDLAKAMKFVSERAAAECWRTQSKTRPLRIDMQPNRPLTAMSVEILDESEVTP